MKRRTCFIWLLSSLIFIQTLAVSLHAASYWSYRNNTIFWNGNWLVGKDMGRFVFYTYAFMFDPLEGNQVNLTSMKGYQEILYRQPESDEERTVKRGRRGAFQETRTTRTAITNLTVMARRR
jgi:hypothetical protein